MIFNLFFIGIPNLELHALFVKFGCENAIGIIRYNLFLNKNDFLCLF